MEPIKFTCTLRDGGVQTSQRTKRLRVEFELDGGHSLQFAQLMVIFEENFDVHLKVKGDKGTDVEFDAIIWRLRSTIDRGLCFIFELDKGNALIAAKLNDSLFKQEVLTVEVKSEGEDGVRTRKIRESKWAPPQRVYPN